MNIGTQEVFVFLLGQLITAAMIYGGIRADLRNMKDAIKDAKENGDDAHERIDSIMGANYHEMHLNRRTGRERRHTDAAT